MRRALLCLLPLLIAGCPKSQHAVTPTWHGPPQAFKLLSETPEAETATRADKRTDLFVNTDTGEPIPTVVAVGEVGPLNRQGRRVRLFGDEAGTQGWSVDNFLFIEVIGPQGRIRNRIAIGFQQGVTFGSEHVDTAGPMAFSFGPGEVDLSSHLPTNEAVTIRATALDVGGVGRVSDVYLIVSPESGGAPSDEELRDEF
jgi:hypothetical protein